MLENPGVLGAMKRVTLATLIVVVTLGTAARAQDTLPIAAIHANLGTYTGQIVTVEGVVTIPANYRGPTFYSGYIQDGSGRGLNLFGGSTASPPFDLNTVGNRLRVTGEVEGAPGPGTTRPRAARAFAVPYRGSSCPCVTTRTRLLPTHPQGASTHAP